MSYQDSRRTPLSKQPVFSWWYVDNWTNFDLPESASPYLRNARFDWFNIVIRPWHALFKTLTAWSTPKWIWSYLRATATNDVLVVRHNQDATHKLVTLTEGWTLTAISTATNITSDAKMNFTNIWDVIYCMNYTDDFWMLSWTTYSLPTTWLTNPKFGFSVMFNGSHFASGWSTNPNVVYKSVGWDWTTPAKLHDFTSTWSDKMTFWESIVWLTTTNQALFYFTKNTIAVTATSDITQTAWTYSYATRQLQTVEGAFNHECIVSVGNNVFYLNSAIQINQIATGQNINWFEVSPLSQRPLKGIQKLMDSLDRDQSWAYGEYVAWPSLVKRHFKSVWSTFPDVVVVYDTIKDKFLVDSNKYMNDWVDFHQKHYSVSAVESKIFIDEYWQSDEDSIIPFEYRTKEYYIWDPTMKKLLRETRTLLDINELAHLTQTIWIDWVQKDSKTIGIANYNPAVVWWIGINAVWEDIIWQDGEEDETKTLIDDDYQEMTILRTKWNLNIKGNKIQFKYINDSLAGKCRLKNITVKLEQLDPMATNLTT